MVECKKEENRIKCNCTYTCDKKGMCCDCLSYHLSMKQLPACCFPDDVEKTYDRSYEKFIEVYSKK